MINYENGIKLIGSTARQKLQKVKLLLTKKGALRTYENFSPLTTIGVRVNQQWEVLVGLCERNSPALIVDTPRIIRQIVVLGQSGTPTGNMKHTYEFNKNNKRLFTWPYKITTLDDKICIVDMLNNSVEARIEVIDYGGNVHWQRFERWGQSKLLPFWHSCDNIWATRGSRLWKTLHTSSG